MVDALSSPSFINRRCHGSTPSRRREDEGPKEPKAREAISGLSLLNIVEQLCFDICFKTRISVLWGSPAGLPLCSC